VSDGAGPRAPFPPPAGPSGTPPIQHAPVPPAPGAPPPPVRTTLLRVMAVQVVALLLLWALQAHFTR
jgi:hypothetical protein